MRYPERCSPIGLVGMDPWAGNQQISRSCCVNIVVITTTIENRKLVDADLNNRRISILTSGTDGAGRDREIC